MVDPFNDPDGRGKHPVDPIEIMVAGFEADIETKDAEIERLRKALRSFTDQLDIEWAKSKEG